MSDLSRLIKEIGVEVQQLSNHVEIEKNNICNLQQKLLLLTQETESQKKFRRQLEEEFQNLESTYFQPDANRCGSDVNETVSEQIRSLNSVLSEIKCNNDRTKKERAAFILEYKQKLEDYNRHIMQTDKLQAFIELWKAKCTDNYKLTAIPEIIKETAEEISNFYETSLLETLENALNPPAVRNEEAEVTPSKTTCITEKDEVSAVISRIHQLNPTHSNQLNLSGDVDTELQDCNVLDASRLRMSALDTSVMSSLVRKESCGFPYKNSEQPDAQRDYTMNMDVTLCGENDASSY
ncbi:hypothetical protein EWB00_000546 [Schistosoma japonicum]|uniref:Uncharacterized protein n=1 Tax=Schistosoma japonicum TaxID=6182 RepID=C1LGE5_SCHJA|nr:hypothetical protein KSF78_0005205 [Schistosoma japonicum]TNN16338.1 hypothetical protein EWB00_000546 [Schistosoma japonicum]CAX73773.1 hypothetical protein [Schistosoma japonicum]